MEKENKRVCEKVPPRLKITFYNIKDKMELTHTCDSYSIKDGFIMLTDEWNCPHFELSKDDDVHSWYKESRLNSIVPLSSYRLNSIKRLNE